MRVLSMTPEQIHMLPPQERATFIQLVCLLSFLKSRGAPDSTPPSLESYSWSPHRMISLLQRPLYRIARIHDPTPIAWICPFTPGHANSLRCSMYIINSGQTTYFSIFARTIKRMVRGNRHICLWAISGPESDTKTCAGNLDHSYGLGRRLYILPFRSMKVFGVSSRVRPRSYEICIWLCGIFLMVHEDLKSTARLRDVAVPL